MWFKYVGPDESRDVWGQVFVVGKATTVSDPALAAKLEALGSFERINDYNGGSVEPTVYADPEEYSEPEPQPAPKKRGRPKGSKSKKG